MANDYYNNITQVRVTELLVTGAEDPSATAQVSTVPKELSISPVYIDGEELEQRGGGATVCTVTEEDAFKGVDLDVTFATIEFEVKEVITGGDLVVSGGDTIGWESSSTTPGPFKLEAWVPHYDTTVGVEGKIDGYLKLTFPFCKGRLADRSHADREFGEDAFTVKARQNPTSGGGAMREEIVETIT
jgi:hypothetical protein